MANQRQAADVAAEFAEQLQAVCPEVDFQLSNADREGPTLEIPPKHPGVGGIMVMFHPCEITVGIGSTYRCHFEPREYVVDSPPKTDPRWIDKAVAFVRDFLTDRVLYYEATGGRFAQIGICHIDYLDRAEIRSDAQVSTWSGPWKGRNAR